MINIRKHSQKRDQRKSETVDYGFFVCVYYLITFDLKNVFHGIFILKFKTYNFLY